MTTEYVQRLTLLLGEDMSGDRSMSLAGLLIVVCEQAFSTTKKILTAGKTAEELMKDIKKHDLTPKESKKKGEAKEILTERTGLFWISHLLNVKKRTARRIIAEVAHEEPVISLSTQKGYRIARTEADVEDALHMVKDLDSRILQLEKRKKPLLKFVNSYMLDKGIANTVRLEQMFPLVEIEDHYTEDYNCRG